MGIIFASCPALRQTIVYIQRSHTLLPSAHRHEPNADFATMRRRVTVRDIMWWQDPKEEKPRVRVHVHVATTHARGSDHRRSDSPAGMRGA